MKAPRYWFDGSPPPLHTRALAKVYGAGSRLRAKLVRPRKVSKPVLVIGNLIAGGSGKTPLTIAVVARLQAAGWTPGVASRGYGRDDAGTPRWVEPVTDPKLAGDEPVLIAARTGAKVRVDADRVAAAKALIAAGCDIVVCDDGLQHYRLRRDVEIEVIDGARRYGNGLLIPAGPLREPAARSAHCDFRVLNTGSDTDLDAGFGEWPMRLETGQALPLVGGRPLPLSRFSGQRVHAVAGIGDPERFFATLRSHDIAVVPHAFADHHRYTAEDLRFGSDLPVLMTEKDAVKCMRFAGERHYSVPVSGELPEAFWIALLDRLAKLR
ncbi:tetraacyldisaccharide 4'-kinase [Luteimonas sp. 3794]|uniref:tetraacyldisaccharide 4'-kinase n=1 Tax=Luteimonas sp. 3794 TaxID=2817730 RepID=UPI00285D8515|nr:tetraacyldisaccharide 4'-kinase [Luteimonas sp. 3794]MDR6992505.1 tetraacyldisaccharide 4'-kinase [Luteimonas sp. 3794]